MSFSNFRLAAFSLLACAVSSCSVFAPSGGGGGAPPPLGDTVPTGCLTTPPQHLAPGGYYVNGNTICTAAGQPHLFHGVARPSTEWSPTGEHISAADFALMASWKANVVRLTMNQDYWLSASPFYDSNYAPLFDMAIGWAEAAGLDVILDLHWSDQGMLGSCTNSCAQLMADANSITFWSEVAARYKGDGRVLFELYNEPYNVSWSVWKSGGATGLGWNAAGMQQMYDAVRAAGADNIVVIGGLNYAFDLSKVPSNRISGYNIAYATHPYGDYPERAASTWDSAWGFLTKTDPVIVTEFGDRVHCDGKYTAQLIPYADSHNAGWTAWGWYPGGCKFPGLIDDWSGTPSVSGTIVNAALAAY